MSEKPLIETYDFSSEAIKKILEQKAIEQFEAPQINEETGKDERPETTIIQATVENKACGDKRVHILYRNGKEEYAD